MSYRNEDKHGANRGKAKKQVFNVGRFRVFCSRHSSDLAVRVQVFKSKPVADPGVKRAEDGKAARAAKLKVCETQSPVDELRVTHSQERRSAEPVPWEQQEEQEEIESEEEEEKGVPSFPPGDWRTVTRLAYL